jgi:hypothetical protein
MARRAPFAPYESSRIANLGLLLVLFCWLRLGLDACGLLRGRVGVVDRWAARLLRGLLMAIRLVMAPFAPAARFGGGIGLAPCVIDGLVMLVVAPRELRDGFHAGQA